MVIHVVCPGDTVYRLSLEYGVPMSQIVADNGISDAHQLVRQSYAWEQLVTSYIEDGRPETLRELFSAPPRVTQPQRAIFSSRVR